MDASCFPQMKSFKKFGSKRSTTLSPLSSRRDLKLDDKVTIITGGASGIGAATARLFVSNGARVLIADVNADAGKKLSSELGSSAHFFHCDVTNEADVAAAVDHAVAAWGHLDIMFNNAGVCGPLSGLADINIEEFDQVMAVHIKGAVLGVKHAARVMTPARKGVILFTGSTSATLGGAGPPLYSAANAAVLCIVRSAAAELIPHGIRVNAVSPHFVATPMSIASFNASVNPSVNPNPDMTVEQFEKLLAASNASDVVTVEKVANAVMFLASDEAGFISGHNLVLDGAFSVTKPFDSSNLKAALQRSLAADRKAETGSNNDGGLTSPGLSRKLSGNLGSKATTTTKKREVENKTRAKDERAREKEEKAAQENKEREKEKQNAEEKARAKEEKAPAEKEFREQQKEKKEKKEREKGEKDKQIAEEKPPAKEAQAPHKDSKANGQQAKDEEIHPLDKKASAKEERIRNEKIELPNAGPEPDIPTEFQAKPPVKRIGSLLSWGRNPSKKERAEEKVSNLNNKKNDKSTEPGNVSKKDKDDKPADPGQASKQKPKDDKSTDPGKVSRKEKKSEKSTDPGKVSKKEKEEEKSADPGKASKKEATPPAEEENGGTASKDSPTIAAASQESPPKAPSAMARIVRLLSPRKGKSRAKDKKVRFERETEEGASPTNEAPTEITLASPESKQDSPVSRVGIA